MCLTGKVEFDSFFTIYVAILLSLVLWRRRKNKLHFPSPPLIIVQASCWDCLKYLGGGVPGWEWQVYVMCPMLSSSYVKFQLVSDGRLEAPCVLHLHSRVSPLWWVPSPIKIQISSRMIWVLIFTAVTFIGLVKPQTSSMSHGWMDGWWAWCWKANRIGPGRSLWIQRRGKDGKGLQRFLFQIPLTFLLLRFSALPRQPFQVECCKESLYQDTNPGVLTLTH